MDHIYRAAPYQPGMSDDGHTNSDESRKRARTQTVEYGTASATDNRSQNQGHRNVTRPRTRGATACQTCRNRRTRCDNGRPQCGYCAKTGETCSYEEDADSFQVFGPRILDAIQNLSNQVQQLQQSQQTQVQDQNHAFSPVTFASIDTFASPIGQALEYQGDANVQNGSSNLLNLSRSGLSGTDKKPAERPSNTIERPFAPQGLEEVAKWKIFSPDASAQVALPVLFATSHRSTQVNGLPDIKYSVLMRLKAHYVKAVHLKNPFLDIQRLDELIPYVAENGFGWDVSTCLVTLVCAIGAAFHHYPMSNNALTVSSTGSVAMSDLIGDMDLALQYWGVASKRIGLAMDETSLEAAQCLCLTGIWYMSLAQPLQAWKYFSLAGNAWYLRSLRRESSPDVRSTQDEGQKLTLEQSLYFTIYKSECELRFELAVPPSILDKIDPMYTFPLPPRIDTRLSTDTAFDAERAWYYYLAEIASRHLINRLLRTQTKMQPLQPTAKYISKMLAQSELFESQLNDWHTSLPGVIKFPEPTAELEPLEDELCNILRARWFTISELMYRPFLHLAVDFELADIASDTLEKVADCATRGLSSSLLKMQSIVVFRHQGLWISLRSVPSVILSLIAASRARGRVDRLAGQKIILPRGWLNQVDIKLEQMLPFCHDPAGGSQEMFRMIKKELEDPGIGPF